MVSSFLTVIRFIKNIFPAVNHELAHWRERAGQIPDLHLRTQALASISLKKFHAQGGAIYALFPSIVEHSSVVRFIVAFQTISDYLDNLCDRLNVADESAFFKLHLSMYDAVNPARTISDYYENYPYQHDGGYLRELVEACRTEILKRRNYTGVLPLIIKYVDLYSHLQAYKHLDWQIREKRLRRWARANFDNKAEIYWHEFAAATGSTLGIFFLFVLSDNSLSTELLEDIDHVYFPWITGLHILLDYYIDAEEDLETGDLNFTSFYRSPEEELSRIQLFVERSLKLSLTLPHAHFHHLVVRGLLAMYLSDPKALTREKLKISQCLLRQGGLQTFLYYHCCIWIRRKGIL